MSEPSDTAAERARDAAVAIVDAMGKDIGEDKVIWPETWRRRIAAALRAAEAGARRAALEEAAVLVETHSEGHRDGERVLFIKKGPGKDAVDGTTYAAGIRALAASSPAAAVAAFEEVARWHDARYVALRDNGPKGEDGLVTDIVGGHMAAHYESAEHFRASSPAAASPRHPIAAPKSPREGGTDG